jgi:hypothetical protein
MMPPSTSSRSTLRPNSLGFAHLLAGDDLGMFLKEAQEFLGCWHLLIVEDTAARLSDPLLYQR